MPPRLFDWFRSAAAAGPSRALHSSRGVSTAAHRARRACVIVAAILTLAWSVSAAAAEEFSAAERALFMTNHLEGLATPAMLQYTFRKSGTLEDSFDDKVAVALKAQPKATCCAATTEFLSGARRVRLPEVESVTGNPVILHFLERDINEMQRLTKGQPNYFRKRIRMAIFQGAQVSDVEVPYGGKQLAARQIMISPYAGDPLRARYEKLADKQYVFTLSKDLPGGVYAIRSRINAASPDAPPLLAEEMVFDPASRALHETSGTAKP